MSGETTESREEEQAPTSLLAGGQSPPRGTNEGAPHASAGPALAVTATGALAAAPIRAVWERIKRHKVVQWTLAYLALAYTLLHSAEMLGNSLGWSHGLLRLFTLLLILGLLALAMGLLWIGQGTGMINWPQSSFMIRQIQWAGYGAALAALGLVLIWQSKR